MSNFRGSCQNAGPFLLQQILAEILDVAVDAVELVGDGDALGAVVEAGAAADAVVGLAERRDGPVVADEVGPFELPVILLPAALGVAALGHGRVVVLEDAGDVDAPGTGHAVLAVGAVDERELLVLHGHTLHELQLFLCQRLEVREGLDILREDVHVRHAAEDAEHARVGPAEAEGPRGRGLVRLALAQLRRNALRHIGEAAAEERFHDDDGDAALVEFGIEVVGVDVADPVGVRPVDIVHLDLAEVPGILAAVEQLHEIVELMPRAMEGKTEVADASGSLFAPQEVDHAVLDIALLEGLPAAAADGMQQIVVEVVGPELLERVPVHLDRGFRGLVPEVGEFRGDIVGLARMAAQGDAGGHLRLALEVGRRRIEIVDTVGDGIVDHLVDGLLVDDLLAILPRHHRPAHAAESDQGDPVTVCRMGTVNHLSGAFIARGSLFALFGSASGRGSTQGKGTGAGQSEKISTFHTHWSLRCS